jgi:AcrR family transcriptional regulator
MAVASVDELPVADQATRRSLTPRQAAVVAELLQATEAELEAVGYEGLTVRGVARRASVAPATAYNYFSSKDHLLAEVLWRRLASLPPLDAEGGADRFERLERAVTSLVLGTTSSPVLMDSCTSAMLSGNPEVKQLRDRIGLIIHRRLAEALGEGVEPMVIRVLETTFTGALLTAGMGHLAFEEIPAFVVGAARLLVADGAGSATSPTTRKRSR